MSKQSRRLILSLGVFIIAISVTGCGVKTVSEKAAENATEKAIEKATNGQADVDLSEGSFRMNTNGGSFQAGESLSLPDGFPSDVYIVDGTIKSAMTTTENKGYTVTIATSKTLEEAAALYDGRLKAEGWNITANMTISAYTSLMAEKGNRVVSVGIGGGEDESTRSVVVTVAETDIVPTGE